MILKLLATWIPALLIALSGVMKLLGNRQVLDTMTTLGVGRYVRWLGVMELAFATLFVIPPTFKLGFVLGSCYFAGAITTELSHDALKPGFPIWPWYPAPQNSHQALIFQGTDARNPATEGDALWVRKNPSRSSSLQWVSEGRVSGIARHF